MARTRDWAKKLILEGQNVIFNEWRVRVGSYIYGSNGLSSKPKGAPRIIEFMRIKLIYISFEIFYSPQWVWGHGHPKENYPASIGLFGVLVITISSSSYIIRNCIINLGYSTSISSPTSPIQWSISRLDALALSRAGMETLRAQWGNG